ncbi:MAG: hypothetical protein CSA96_01345 [Bacteroidetes bacterium]|nr:MAG: hypothetical protein CSA96_01345 [Bacteroidota bacterium]
MHFGTHGSLEFTPGKQVALSDYDWADRLIGPVPHFYNYTISNIGEGIIAKRRSYATLLTHLTPPFMKSGLRDELVIIHDKLHRYSALPDGPVKEQYAASTKELAEKMEMHLTLGLDSTRPYGHEEMHTIHEYLEEIEQSKVGAGLYTMGIPYTPEKQRNTALLVSIDPVAFAMADLDLQKGKISNEEFQDGLFVSKNYRPKASELVSQILEGANAQTVISRVLSEKDRSMAHQWEEENKEVDLMGLMMSFGTDKGKTGVDARDADQLPALVARLCSEEKNREYIESLESEQLFEKATGLLDENDRRKAKKMAERMKNMAPEMYEMISVGTQEEMLELLQLMQDSLTKTRVFELLKDEGLAERIEKQHVALMKERALQCDDKVLAGWMEKALSGLEEDMLPKDKQELSKGIRGLKFIQANSACFSHCQEAVYGQYEGNQEAWNTALKSSISLLERQLAKVKAKEADYARAVLKIERGLNKAYRVLEKLGESPKAELASILNALDGGFTSPSSGGDPIVNPAALPTGRNMYSVDAERTPSEEAWKVGKRLAESLLKEEYALKGHYPKKISFTLWSTNFISTEGATIAQILYLLGVEPIRDGFGSVRNLKLIPMDRLGRPRIDVVIQTSGQLRDLAASRLDLINRAIAMAADAKDADSLNYVKSGILTSEKYLLDQGFSPLDARSYASKRIFGGVNGNYGTGIMSLVEKGDAWEDEEEIARQYLNNMGAIYEKGENWGMFREGIFQAALQETETVVQPRSSNTWGPLSLDHVYEFMGGMNLTIRHVTGNDPTAYFNDFRNTSRPKMQELKKAIGVETNSTVFNPKYIGELLAGEASSMEEFAETFRNTYGWNVMKPDAIDQHIWNNYFDVYVEDIYDLGVRERFEEENPYALQEMTSVMLETARKGYWKASSAQLKALAELHAGLVTEYEAGCSGFVCDNALLRTFISKQLPADQAENYQQAIEAERKASINENQEKVVLEKVENQTKSDRKASPDKQRKLSLVVVFAVIVLFILFFVIRRRH